MVASKLSRSIFISDPGNRCLWRIQMPGREISRWEVDGTPYNDVDQFIGCVGRAWYSWWSFVLESEPVQIVGCDVDRVDPSTNRNETCCGMQFSCRMETSSSLIRRTTTRMCSSSVNSRSMGGSSSGVSILDRLHRLDWMVGHLIISRSVKMETYSLLTGH